ncbi:MAG: sugar phosphate isomerase/epimerase family protein, partial [bacterium]
RAFGEDGLSFSDPDPGVRGKAVGRISSHIELASLLGCRVILGLILGKNPPSPETEKRILDCLRPCAELAEEKKVVLVVEPINRYETGFINRVDDCLALLDRLGRPACRVLLDTFHMNIEEPSIHDSIAKAGGRIGHVHVADSNRWYPGAGHLDFPEILRALKKTGYSGFLSAEILPLPDPETAAARTAENLRAFLRDLGEERKET